MDTIILVVLVMVLILELARFVIKPNYEEITDEITEVLKQSTKTMVQVENLTKQVDGNKTTLDTLINNKFSEEREYFNTKFNEEREFFNTKFNEEREFFNTKFTEEREFSNAKFNEEKEFLQNLKHDMFKENTEHSEKMNRTLKESIHEIQQSNERKLTEIQDNVNEKLDKSLNERLDVSFRQIGEQLAGLNKSIGELQSLSSGVMDLQKTLSNVKTRGVFGEIQLANILSSTMDPSQYEENVATKLNSNERVEFAIKIPDKEDMGEFVYLPIDSKFPADLYTRIVDASNSGDGEAIKSASKELETRIKNEAKSIRDKYIDSPRTTDFAIMFLPTEGLYSEVLRIAGLTEWCQNEAKVVISGPTTITALLNSLSIGFKYLTVNKNSKDILKTLSAVKTQYDKFGVLISKTQKKLSEAQRYTDDMQHRSQMIQRRLTKIDSVSEEESIKTLNIIVDEEEEE